MCTNTKYLFLDKRRRLLPHDYITEVVPLVFHFPCKMIEVPEITICVAGVTPSVF